MNLQFPINLKDYTPAGAKILATWLPWFGASAHRNVSTYYPGAIDYNSQDFATCERQIAAMQTAGVDAAVLVYDGRGVVFDDVALAHMAEACQRAAFPYAIMVDVAAINFRPNKTLTPTQEYAWIAQYLAAEHLHEPFYMLDGTGRPIVFIFGDTTVSTTTAPLDWSGTIVPAFAPFSPALLFRGANAFARSEAAGGYGWASVTNDPLDPGLSALFGFNKAAAANAGKLAVHGVYPGFNDANPTDPTHSVWDATAPARFTPRRGGLTLLDSLAAVPATAKYVLVATWNDYEEGTAIELQQN